MIRVCGKTCLYSLFERKSFYLTLTFCTSVLNVTLERIWRSFMRNNFWLHVTFILHTQPWHYLKAMVNRVILLNTTANQSINAVTLYRIQAKIIDCIRIIKNDSTRVSHKYFCLVVNNRRNTLLKFFSRNS